MPTKVCEHCFGSGQIQDWRDTSKYLSCIECYGSGEIHYNAPKPQSPPQSPPSTRTSRPRKPSESSFKGWRELLAIGGCVGVYFLCVVYITENLIMAGVIAIIAFFIVYRWYKYFLAIAILGVAIYFIFLKDKV